MVHQLPDLLGLPGASGSTLHRVGVTLSGLHLINGWTLGIGVGVFTVVVVAERVDRRIPGALVGLIGSTILVGAMNLNAHGVKVLVALAHGGPHLGLHGLSWSALGAVAPIAGVVALVIISQTAATTRAFADQAHMRSTSIVTSSALEPAMSSPAWSAPSRWTQARHEPPLWSRPLGGPRWPDWLLPVASCC